METVHFVCESCLLVVKPVYNKREVLYRYCRSKWDVCHGIDGSSYEKMKALFLIGGKGVAPETTDIVLTISEEDIGNASSVSGEGVCVCVCVCMQLLARVCVCVCVCV